jgi:hypothetical protein
MDDLPPLGEVFGLIAGIGFVGGLGGWIAGEIAKYLAPHQGFDPDRWGLTTGRWAAFAASMYFLYRWTGLA